MSDTQTRSIWKAVLGVVVGALIIGVPGCYVWFQYRLDADIDQELQAIRDAGLPVYLADVPNCWPPPTPSDDATPILKNAFVAFVPGDKLVEDDWRLPPPGEELSQQTEALLRQHLTANAQALQLLRAASAKKACRFSAPSPPFVHVASFPTAELKRVARLLQQQAVLFSGEEDPEGAVAALVTMLHLARALEHDTFILGLLLRIDFVQDAASGLEYVVNRCPIDDASLANLAKLFRQAQSAEHLRRALATERAANNDAWDPLAREGIRIKMIFRYGLHAQAEQMALCDLPVHERVAGAILQDEREMDRARSRLHALLFPPSVLAPSPVIILADARTVAISRCAETACAIERYRLAHGELPNALADLVPAYLPEVPIDPFDGNRLRYQPQDGGYVVYSVSKDGEDDRGVLAQDEGEAWESGDLTFRVIPQPRDDTTRFDSPPNDDAGSGGGQR